MPALTAHQPAYLPWLGYFDKIIRSDIFIFLDSVQFEKNSFTNRNKIKVSQGWTWLTIPVKTKDHLASTLKDLEIDNSKQWKKDHLKTIYFNYKKATRFDRCYPKIEALYAKDHRLLSELCWDHLRFWMDEIGIDKQVVRSSEITIDSKKSDLILDLCKHFKVERYISGALGKNYLDEKVFKASGIVIEYQEYKHPTYPQMWGEFMPNLSILDFWMNSNDYRLLTGG